MITAFGETKDINAWAHDPRCVVTPATVAARISRGWSPEEAITVKLGSLQRRHTAGSVLGLMQVRKPVDRCPECGQPVIKCVSPCVEAIKRELNKEYPVDGEPHSEDGGTKGNA